MTRFLQNAGSYRHPITIQEQDEQNPVTNEYGEKVSTWVDVVKTRAGIYPISGREFISAEAITSELTHKVHLRYLPNITPDMRINLNGRLFKVISVINFQEMNKELQLVCKELLNQ